jgi:hypothetical protein
MGALSKMSTPATPSSPPAARPRCSEHDQRDGRKDPDDRIAWQESEAPTGLTISAMPYVANAAKMTVEGLEPGKTVLR